MGFTDDEKLLLNKYLNEVQSVYAEYEVLGGKVPADAEMRVAEFLTALSQARFGGSGISQNDCYNEANELLNAALFHCHKGLAAMYVAAADEQLAEIGKEVVEELDDCKFKEQIDNLHRDFLKQNDALRNRRADILRFTPGLSSLKPRDIERVLGLDDEMCNCASQMYIAAKSYYEKASEGLPKAKSLIASFTPPDFLARIENRVSVFLLAAGMMGLAVFVVRRVLGI